MNAKQRYLEQMAERKLKHKFFTTRKLISFSLAMAFLGVSIVLIGIVHGISSTANYTAGIGTLILVSTPYPLLFYEMLPSPIPDNIRFLFQMSGSQEVQ